MPVPVGVTQQIRGNWSPASMFTRRVVPKVVWRVTIPRCAPVTVPMIEDCAPSGCRAWRQGWRRRNRARRWRRACLRSPRTSGSSPSRSQALRTSSRTGMASSSGPFPPRTGRRSRAACSQGRRGWGRAWRGFRWPRRASANQSIQRRGIALGGSIEGDALALRRGSRCRDRRASPRAVPGRPAARWPAEDQARRHEADAGGVDEDAVAAALLDHLGIAGDDLDAGGFGGPRHGSLMRRSSAIAKPSSRMNAALR